MADNIVLGAESFGTADMKPDGGGYSEANVIWARLMAANVGHVLGKWGTVSLDLAGAGTTQGTATVSLTSYGFNEPPELHFLLNLGGTQLIDPRSSLYDFNDLHFLVDHISTGSFYVKTKTTGAAWTQALYGTILWRCRGF